MCELLGNVQKNNTIKHISRCFFLIDLVFLVLVQDFPTITIPAARGRRIKQPLWSDSLLIKLIFVFEDLQRNVIRMQKLSMMSRPCVVVPAVLGEMYRLSCILRLCLLHFAYHGRIAARIVSVRRLAEGEGVWRHYAECAGRHWSLQTQTNQWWSNTQQTVLAARLSQFVNSGGWIHSNPNIKFEYDDL